MTPRFGTCKDEVRQRDGRSYGWEPVVFLWKPGPRPMYPYGRKEPLDFFVADWKAHLGNKLAGQHPCPRPVDVLEAIIDNYTLPNALILDPMAGSGIYLRGSGSHWTKISRNRTQRSVRSLGTKTVESRSLNARLRWIANSTEEKKEGGLRMETEIRLRIVLVDPPTGVDFGVQEGKGNDYTTIQKQRSKDADLIFEVTLKAKNNRDDGSPNFLGTLAQGPATGRFIYIDIGKLAGQPDSC